MTKQRAHQAAHGLAPAAVLSVLLLPDAPVAAPACCSQSSSWCHLPPVSWQVQGLQKKKQQGEGVQGEPLPLPLDLPPSHSQAAP